jgi:hypothetical protein
MRLVSSEARLSDGELHQATMVRRRAPASRGIADMWHLGWVEGIGWATSVARLGLSMKSCTKWRDSRMQRGLRDINSVTSMHI